MCVTLCLCVCKVSDVVVESQPCSPFTPPHVTQLTPGVTSENILDDSLLDDDTDDKGSESKA